MTIVKLVKTVVVCPRSMTKELLERLYRFGEFHLESNENEKRLEIINELYTRVRDIYNELEAVVMDLDITTSQGVIDILLKGEKVERHSLTVSGMSELVEKIEAEANKILNIVRSSRKELAEIDKALQEAEREAATLRLFVKTGLDYSGLRKLRRFNVSIYLAQTRDIPEVRKTLDQAFMKILPLDRTNAILLIISRSIDTERVEKIAKSYNLKRVEAPGELLATPTEALKFAEERITELKERRMNILKTLEELVSREGQRIYALRDAASLLKESLDKLRGRYKRTAVFIGYIPSTKRDELLRAVGDVGYVEFSEPEPPHHGRQESTPTLLRHNWYFDAYRPIVEMQGTPSYFEVDPTPFVSVFLAVFYGIMAADLGQGLILAILGLLIYMRAKGGLRTWGKLLLFLGVSASICGFLIQEAFGFKLSGLTGIKPLIELVEHHGDAASLNRDGVILLFSYAPLLGFVHVATGLILGAIKLFKLREIAEAVFSKISAVLMYVFGILFVLGFIGAGSFDALFTSTSPAPLIGLPSSQVGLTGLYGVVGCIFVLLFGKLVAGMVGIGPRVSLVSAMGGGLLEVLENIIHFMSNSLSYLRVSILLVIHVVLMMLVNAAWNGLGWASLPILIVGNIGILGLEGTLAFIQALRLHLYEFFTKFYDGSGKPFTPLRISTRMIEVVFRSGLA